MDLAENASQGFTSAGRTAPDHTDLYLPFDPLLFFADVGNDDQFAFVLPEERKDVFAWNHEDGSRSWVAPDLAQYLTWWLDGRIRRQDPTDPDARAERASRRRSGTHSSRPPAGASSARGSVVEGRDRRIVP